jgi:hypothetical protein
VTSEETRPPTTIAPAAPDYAVLIPKESQAGLHGWPDRENARVSLVCDDLAERSHVTLVRINPCESDLPPGQVALPVVALEALHDIDCGFKPLDETLR